jgi:hypothetical protein
VNRIKSTLARLGIRDFKPLSPRSIAEEDAKRPNRERECLVGDVGTRAMPAMAPFPTQPPQEPRLEQFGVQPIGLCPAMFSRNRHTRGMDHVCLYPARLEPARQPKAVAVIRVIVRPALTASSRQRCSTASNLLRGRQCAPGLGKRAGSCTYGALGLMSKPVGDSARSSRNFRLTVGHMETSEQRTAGYIYDDTSLGGTTCRPTTPSRREPLPASSRTKSGRTFDQAAAQRGKGLLVSEPAGRLYRLARPLVPRAELDEPSPAGVQLLSGMLARGSAAQFRQVSTDKSVRARYHRPWMRPVVGANRWMRQPILRTIHSFPMFRAL